MKSQLQIAPHNRVPASLTVVARVRQMPELHYSTRLITKVLPTEFVLEHSAQVRAEHFTFARMMETDLYYYNGTTVTFKELRLALTGEGKDHDYYSYRLWAVEHWEECGNDGHVEYIPVGLYHVHFGEEMDFNLISGVQIMKAISDQVDWETKEIKSK